MLSWQGRSQATSFWPPRSLVIAEERWLFLTQSSCSGSDLMRHWIQVCWVGMEDGMLLPFARQHSSVPGSQTISKCILKGMEKRIE
jgi:hypothetical protein